MDIGAIIELISGVGFPIALVVVLMWFIFKLQNESVARENKLYEVIGTYGNKLGEIGEILTQVGDALSSLTDRVIEIENKIENNN